MKKPVPKIVLPAVVVLIAVTILAVFYLWPKKSETIEGPLLKSELEEINLLASTKIKNPPQIKPDVVKPKIFAKKYLLYDTQAGYPIIEMGGYDRVPIASTTKIMTAIIVLEKYKLDKIVTVDPASTRVAGSKIMLLGGEEITIESLLKGLLIRSGNDTAYVLAKQMGTVENFVAAMNQKAAELGLTQTRFYDPAGLDDNGYSTAFDLAVMLRYVLQMPKFIEITQIANTTIYSADGQISHEIENSNRLMTDEMFFEGSLGGKTGYTPTAGHILITAAQRDGHRLIATIINTLENTSDASAKEAEKLLSWGFENVAF